LKFHWFFISFLVLGGSVYSQSSPEMVMTSTDNETYVTVQMASINSIGAFKENWKSGSGFYAGYGLIYSDNGSLLLQTGYINFDANEDAGFQSDSKFSLIPLMVGGRYYILRDRFRPFVHAMSGFNVISQDWATADSSLSGTEWHLAFQVGIGLDIMLFSGLQIEAAAKYNSHLLDPSKPYNITGLEYNIGLIWRFSGP